MQQHYDKNKEFHLHIADRVRVQTSHQTSRKDPRVISKLRQDKQINPYEQQSSEYNTNTQLQYSQSMPGVGRGSSVGSIRQQRKNNQNSDSTMPSAEFTSKSGFSKEVYFNKLNSVPSEIQNQNNIYIANDQMAKTFHGEGNKTYANFQSHSNFQRVGDRSNSQVIARQLTLPARVRTAATGAARVNKSLEQRKQLEMPGLSDVNFHNPKSDKLFELPKSSEKEQKLGQKKQALMESLQSALDVVNRPTDASVESVVQSDPNVVPGHRGYNSQSLQKYGNDSSNKQFFSSRFDQHMKYGVQAGFEVLTPGQNETMPKQFLNKSIDTVSRAKQDMTDLSSSQQILLNKASKHVISGFNMDHVKTHTNLKVNKIEDLVNRENILQKTDQVLPVTISGQSMSKARRGDTSECFNLDQESSIPTFRQADSNTQTSLNRSTVASRGQQRLTSKQKKQRDMQLKFQEQHHTKTFQEYQAKYNVQKGVFDKFSQAINDLSVQPMKDSKEPKNIKQMEKWVDKNLIECYQLNIPASISTSRGKSALLAYQIDRLTLNNMGISSKDVDRIYRGLYLNTVGWFNMLKDVIEHATGNQGELMTRIWKAYQVLLQFACETDYKLITQTLQEDKERGIKEARVAFEKYKKDREDKDKEQEKILHEMEAKFAVLNSSKIQAEKDKVKAERALVQKDTKHEDEIRLRLDFEIKINKMHNLNQQLQNHQHTLNIKIQQLASTLADTKARNVQLEKEIMELRAFQARSELNEAESKVQFIKLEEQHEAMLTKLTEAQLETSNIDKQLTVKVQANIQLQQLLQQKMSVISTLQDFIEQMKKKDAGMDLQFKHLMNQLEEKEKDIESEIDKKHQQEREVDAIKAEQTINAFDKSELENAKGRVADLERQLDILLSSSDNKNTKIHRLETDIARMETKHNELKENYKETLLRVAEMDAQNQQMKMTANQIVKEKQNVENNLFTLEKRYYDLDKNNQETKVLLSQSKTDYWTLEQKLDNFQKQINLYVVEIEDQTNRAKSWEAKFDQLHFSFNEQANAFKQAQLLNFKNKTEIDELKRTIELNESQIASQKSEIEGLVDLNSALGKNVMMRSIMKAFVFRIIKQLIQSNEEFAADLQDEIKTLKLRLERACMEQEDLRAKGSIFMAIKAAHDSVVAGKMDEISALAKELVKTQDALDSEQHLVQEMVDKRIENDKKIETLNKNLYDQKTGFVKQIESIDKEKKRLQKANQKLTYEMTVLEGKLEEYPIILDEANSKIESLQTQLATIMKQKEKFDISTQTNFVRDKFDIGQQTDKVFVYTTTQVKQMLKHSANKAKKVKTRNVVELNNESKSLNDKEEYSDTPSVSDYDDNSKNQDVSNTEQTLKELSRDFAKKKPNFERSRQRRQSFSYTSKKLAITQDQILMISSTTKPGQSQKQVITKFDPASIENLSQQQSNLIMKMASSLSSKLRNDQLGSDSRLPSLKIMEQMSQENKSKSTRHPTGQMTRQMTGQNSKGDMNMVSSPDHDLRQSHRRDDTLYPKGQPIDSTLENKSQQRENNYEVNCDTPPKGQVNKDLVIEHQQNGSANTQIRVKSTRRKKQSRSPGRRPDTSDKAKTMGGMRKILRAAYARDDFD